MPTETLQNSAPPPAPPASAPRHRYRMRFAKTGELRFVSHHDLMHVLERMMRRAELPFAVTQGFHPQPKMSFALSLALGVVGRNEVFDVELTRDLPADEVLARLNRHAPAGLSFSSVIRPDKKPSSQVRRAFYKLIFCGDKPIGLSDASPSPNGLNGASSPSPNGDNGALSPRIAAFLSQTEHWVLRTRPQRRRINIRPFVADLSADDSGPVPTLSMILWVTPTGAARPEEIVQALGLRPVLDTGAVLERTHLELLDEVPEHERFVPDLTACAASAPATAQDSETPPTNDAPGESPSGESRESRAPQHTSLIANPLSFDS